MEAFNKKLKAENREFSDRILCGICCENKREVLFLGCGHIYCCIQCSLKLKTCPIDQKPIQKRHKFNLCDKYGITEELEDFAKTSYHRNVITLLFGSNSTNSTVTSKKCISETDEYFELKRKNENYRRYFACVGCNQSNKQIIFLDCCHFAYCDSCASKFTMCPFDQNMISKKHKGFIS